MSKLRQSETEKKREIDNLKIELSKGHFRINQMEEEIQRDKQLLEVRCKLINSLQSKEKDQQKHMEELCSQVSEKNRAINEVGGVRIRNITK